MGTEMRLFQRLGAGQTFGVEGWGAFQTTGGEKTSQEEGGLSRGRCGLESSPVWWQGHVQRWRKKGSDWEAGLCQFPGAAALKDHKLNGLKQQNVLCLVSGSRKSRGKLSAGLCFLWTLLQFPAVLGVARVCLCLCPNFPVLRKTSVIGFGVHHVPACPHCDLITSAKTPLPISAHSQVLEVRMWAYLWGTRLSPHQADLWRVPDAMLRRVFGEGLWL